MNQLSPKNIKQWNEGSFFKAYEILGAHLQENSARFAVWAPRASSVSVVGDFNGWDGRQHPMQKDESTGIWSAFVPEVERGALYKFEIKSPRQKNSFLKADPYGRMMEVRPKTASVVYHLESFDWSDEEWLSRRRKREWRQEPISIYEVHAGSWQRTDDNEPLGYRELARRLIPYVKSGGFTHIELLPVAEHPHDPSWGYQVTGYFAPTSRFGEPKDFMYFINECHKNGIGVILDWVPGHFPKDEHGLQLFDGAPLYEYGDPKKREQKDWNTLIFDYEKAGVRNFLLSNAHYWCEKFHIDGLRVDAVASMLYLDYSKGPGEWAPNEKGGKENLEAIEFLKDVNALVHREFPGVLTFAEESTAWPGVTKRVEKGGLGFDFKWNMGWMNDTLSYITKDEKERKQEPGKITFPMMYNQSEYFVLPLSHDEVVHLKKPLLKKSPGSGHEQFANLRLLLSYLFTHPGKKLLFMGDEFGETREWDENRALDWPLLEKNAHRGIKNLLDDLNRLYKREKALHQTDREETNFEWIETGKDIPSLFAFLRKSEDSSIQVLIVLNFSENEVKSFAPAVFDSLQFDVIFNSDSEYYAGTNGGGFIEEGKLSLEPFSALILKAGRQK
ncbi:MAG TPA: 1,4-alpha-glucan branching protein GlgB [Balneolaceae bacterium]|nr:1,4-alpha-glucan branching protein GlgB [Balneolaceae bacterium]